MTKYRWRSSDAHFQHGAVTVSLSHLPINVADTLVMDNSERIAYQLTNLQNQKWLKLHWVSFSEWCFYRVAVSFASDGWQYIDYG